MMKAKDNLGTLTGGSNPQTSQPTQPERFLQLLGKDPAKTWFRCIPPGKGPIRHLNGTDLQGFDLAALEADNRAGASIYFITGDADQATGKHKTGKPTGAVEDPDVHTCPTLFVEWDGKPIEWQVQAWRELGLPEPSAMVTTGGKSVHCYWVLTEPLPPDQWRAVTQRLIKYCSSDPQCSNPSRLMRMPGFAYIDKKTGKPNGQRADLIHNRDTRYTLQQILDCLLEPEPEVLSAKPSGPFASSARKAAADLPPRTLEQIEAAAQYVSQRIPGQTPDSPHHYEQCRRALCGCAAALTEIGHPDPEGHALDLLAGKWPSYLDAQQVLRSSTTREAKSFWSVAKANGYDARRHDLKRELGPAGRKARFTPSPTSTAKWGKRTLSHAKAMACFDKCVQVQAARERNSLRRRARLFKAVSDLGLKQAINRQDIAQRVLEAKDQHQGNAYRGLTAADRLAMEWPEVDWLIPDLLPANDLSIIGGRPKVGKTAMAMAIAAAVLKQTRVAGFDPPKSTRPIIVISDDQGDADTKLALTHLGIFDHPQLIWSRRFRLNESDLDQLLADVRSNPGALVILDSLRSVSRALQHGENDPEIGAVIYDLKAAVMDAGGSVLLVHHCNKGPGLTGVEALSGHNAIAGAANTVITLHYVENAKGQPDKEAMQRRMVREGRTGAPLDWVISRTAGTATFHQVGTWASWQDQIEQTKQEDKREASQTGTKRKVLETLQEHTGQMLTCREVVQAMRLDWGNGRGSSKDPARVRRALNALADDGQIERVRAGTEYTFRAANALASYSTSINNVNSVSTTAAQSVSALTLNVSAVSRPEASPPPAKTPPQPADTADIQCQRSDQLQLKGADAVDTLGEPTALEVGQPVELLDPSTGEWASDWWVKWVDRRPCATHVQLANDGLQKVQAVQLDWVRPRGGAGGRSHRC